MGKNKGESLNEESVGSQWFVVLVNHFGPSHNDRLLGAVMGIQSSSFFVYQPISAHSFINSIE